MATKGTISLDKFSDEVVSILNEWKVDVDLACEKGADKTINSMRDHIKRKTKKDVETSQRNKNNPSAQYVNCFVTRKPRRGSKNKFLRALWNKQYQLSHLLEDGHDSYNQWNKTPELARRYGRNGKPLPRPYTIKKSRFPSSIGKKHTHSFEMWKSTEDFGAKKFPEKVIKELENMYR